MVCLSQDVVVRSDKDGLFVSRRCGKVGQGWSVCLKTLW